MKRLLTHREFPTPSALLTAPVNESGIYTPTDLKPYETRLVELKAIITSEHSFSGGLPDGGTPAEIEDREEGLTKLLLAKWDDCGTSSSRFVPSEGILQIDSSPSWWPPSRSSRPS